MAVTLTVSESLGGSAVADALEGGGSGVDLGSVTNGNYAPIISKSANTGKQDLYIRHDATIDPITAFSVFIQQYGTGTGYTYGGAATAAGDYTSIKALGNASGSSKNNNDGLSGGLWLEMDAGVSTSSAFDQASRGTYVKIFGDNSTDGTTLATAFLVSSKAMVYSSSGEQIATSPVDGKIGKSGDTALGTNAHLQFRIYLPTGSTSGGVFQWETVFSYSFTA
jgi:hypothetical protein